MWLLILEVGSIAAALMSISALLVLVVKPIRNKFKKVFGTNRAQLALLRSEITQMYYKYLAQESLPTYVRENLIMLFDAYVDGGGNSYVCQLYKDMLTWTVYMVNPGKEPAKAGAR